MVEYYLEWIYSERNMRMTAKEYLSQAYLLEQQVRVKLEQIESLKSLASYVSVDFTREPVSHTRNVSSMQDTVLKIMELNKELDARVDALVDKKIEIMKTIDQVQRVEYRLILEERYISFCTWGEIAMDLQYSLRNVQRMHGKALKIVQEILDREQ